VACFIFGLLSGTRTGRRSAERKKAAGGRLFSPRVESLCIVEAPGTGVNTMHKKTSM